MSVVEVKTGARGLILKSLEGRLVQGADNATVVNILLPKESDGVSLLGFSWQMRGTAVHGDTLALSMLSADESGEKILIPWTIPWEFTAKSGELELMLEGTKGNAVVRFRGDKLEVIKSISGTYAPAPDYLDSILRQVSQALRDSTAARNAAIAAAEDARRSAEAAATLLIFDPTTGTQNSIQQVVNNLFALHATGAITPEEFDALNILPENFDALMIDPLDFDLDAKNIL